MRRKPVTLVLFSLLALTFLVAGCRRQGAPPLETLVPEDEETAMVEEAEQNTEDMEDEATATAVPAEDGEEPDQEDQQQEPVSPTATTAPVEDQEQQVQPTATATTAPQPTATETTVQPTAAPTTDGTGGTTVYTVQPGDNLFRIALRFNTSVPAIAQANNITNPSLIYVGQRLTIPSDGTAAPQPPAPGGQCSTVYTVQPGDNLFRIALRYNYSQFYLAQVNGISNPSTIYVGQQICIP